MYQSNDCFNALLTPVFKVEYKTGFYIYTVRLSYLPPHYSLARPILLLITGLICVVFNSIVAIRVIRSRKSNATAKDNKVVPPVKPLRDLQKGMQLMSARLIHNSRSIQRSSQGSLYLPLMPSQHFSRWRSQFIPGTTRIPTIPIMSGGTRFAATPIGIPKLLLTPSTGTACSIL